MGSRRHQVASEKLRVPRKTWGRGVTKSLRRNYECLEKHGVEASPSRFGENTSAKKNMGSRRHKDASGKLRVPRKTWGRGVTKSRRGNYECQEKHGVEASPSRVGETTSAKKNMGSRRHQVASGKLRVQRKTWGRGVTKSLRGNYECQEKHGVEASPSRFGETTSAKRNMGSRRHQVASGKLRVPRKTWGRGVTKSLRRNYECQEKHGV